MPENLTHKHVEKVLRATERMEITDSKVTGLILRGKASGVTWAFRSNKLRGSNIRKTLGSYPALSLAQARQIAQAANDRIGSGLGIDERWIAEQRVAIGAQEAMPDTVPAGRVRPHSWLYEEAVEAYLVAIAPSKRPATIRSYREKLTHPALKAAFAGVAICDIQRRHASKVVEEVAAQRSTTAEDMVGALGRLWSWMASDNQQSKSGITENAMLGLKRPDIPLSRKRGAHIQNPAMSALGRIVVACRSGILHPATARAIEITVLTAQRRETVASTLLSDLDLSGSQPVWRISSDHMKMGLSHWLPLTQRVSDVFKEAALDAAEERSRFAFPQARPKRSGDELTHVHPHTLTHYMRYIGDTTPHRVRIAFTSNCGLKANEAAVVLDHLEGRKDITDIHYNRDHRLALKAEYLSRWEAALQPHIEAARRDFDPDAVLAEIRRIKKAAQKGDRKRLRDQITEAVERKMSADAAEQAAHDRDRRILDDVLEALRAGTMSPEEVKHRLRLDA